MSWWSRGFSPSRFFLRGECFDTFPTCLTNNKKNWIYELNESLKEEMSLLYQPTNGYTSQLWALWDPCNPPQRCKHLSKTRETKNRLLTNPFWSSRSFFSHPSPCCFCFLHFQLWPVTYLHLRQARGTTSRSRGASVACSVCVCFFFFSPGCLWKLSWGTCPLHLGPVCVHTNGSFRGGEFVWLATVRLIRSGVSIPAALLCLQSHRHRT